jgi:hypothetical protein
MRGSAQFPPSCPAIIIFPLMLKGRLQGFRAARLNLSVGHFVVASKKAHYDRWRFGSKRESIPHD